MTPPYDRERIDRIIFELRKKWSYIDIDSFYPEKAIPHEWRELVEDMLTIIERDAESPERDPA